MDLSRLRITQKARTGGLSFGLLVVVALLAFAGGFFVGRSASVRRSSAPLEVSTVVAGSAARTGGRSFTAGGWIEVPVPQYPILVSSRISQRLDTLHVRHGDTVTGGQIIAKLYDGDARSRLDVAKARAAEAAEKLRLAKASYERSQALEDGVLSIEELDREHAMFVTAREAAAAAQATQGLAAKELSYCTIRIPTNLPPLRVLDVFHTPGEWIARDKKAAVVALYDPGTMQMRVDVPQTNVRFVKAGQAVKIRTEAQASREYKGTVLRVDPLAELAKNTVTVRIAVDDPDQMLFPEMVAHATFLNDEPEQTSRRREVVVPAGAIGGANGDRYVFVVEEGRARRRTVVTGDVTGNRVVISDGVRSGQRVIVDRVDELSDGQAVEVK